MFEHDYLGRMIKDFIDGILRNLQLVREKENPLEAAHNIEQLLENCTDIDGSILLSLEPISLVNMLEVSNADPKLCVYIAHSLKMESILLKKAEKTELSELRMEQAKAVAKTYDVALDEIPVELNDSLAEEDTNLIEHNIINI